MEGNHTRSTRLIIYKCQAYDLNKIIPIACQTLFLYYNPSLSLTTIIITLIKLQDVFYNI